MSDKEKATYIHYVLEHMMELKDDEDQILVLVALRFFQDIQPKNNN